MIHICEPDIGKNEKYWVNLALKRSDLSGRCNIVRLFEKTFTEFIGAEFALCCPNGSVAFHLILAALDIKQGDEVILPSQTISSCASAISSLGATVAVVDVNKDTWTMDPSKLEKAVTKKTRAIVPTAIYAGIPPDMRSILDICRRYNDICIIEDFSEAIGTKYDGKYLGSIGDVGFCSLFANKSLTCVPAGTKIATKRQRGIGSRSARNIEDIKVGDLVWTYCEATGEKELDKVVDIQNRNAEKLLRLHFSNGNYLDITKEHPIFVHNFGWVNAGDLKVGDCVIQLLYHGLQARLNGIKQTGKHYEDFLGEEEAARRRRNHSEALKKSHIDPYSGYNPDARIVEITKIEELPKSTIVYNITTEKNHNYFAYGILVHNCGEGGVITTNSEELYKKMRYLGDCAFRGGIDRFSIVDLGYNYRYNGLQAAFGIGQLERRKELFDRRKEINSWYRKYVDSSYVWQTIPEKSEIVPWMNAALCPPDINRDDLSNYLLEKGIETRPTFLPVGKLEYFKKGYSVISYGEKVSMDIYKRGILFPSGGKSITEEVVRNICSVIKEYK